MKANENSIGAPYDRFCIELVRKYLGVTQESSPKELHQRSSTYKAVMIKYSKYIIAQRPFTHLGNRYRWE